MKIEIDLDEAEVAALRNGGQVPLSLRDKLGDAVHTLDIGWYLIDCDRHGSIRPRYWDGERWQYGPDGRFAAHVVENSEPQRLYTADER
jgi:hypothetical protein